jgi:hypothetical protein
MQIVTVDISPCKLGYVQAACTKTRNNRNETTGTTGQESKMTGTIETKIEHDPNKVP